MPKLENWNRAASNRTAKEEISEGEEEYKREEKGGRGPEGKYWNDEDIEAVYGGYDNEDEDDSGYMMHGVYYDEKMQILEESILQGDFSSADNVLDYYKRLDNIRLVLKNVVVSYLFLPKDQLNLSMNRLTDFLNQTKTSRTKGLNFSPSQFLDSSEVKAFINNELGDRDDEQGYLESLNRLNISLKKKERLGLDWIKEQLETGYFGYIQEFKEQILKHFKNLDFTEIEEFALVGIKNALSSKNTSLFSILMNNSLIPSDKINSPEMKEIATNSFWDCLSLGYIDGALEIRERFEFLTDLPDTPEVKEKILEALVDNLSRGAAEGAIKIKDNFNISPEKINSPEVEQAALVGLSNGLTDRYCNILGAIKIKDNFPISPEKLELVAVKGIISRLPAGSFGNFEIIEEIKENFPISPEKLSSPEVERAVLDYLNQCPQDYFVREALKVKEHFSIVPEKLEKIALKNLIYFLSAGDYSNVIKIKAEIFISSENLSSLEVEQAVLACLDRALSTDRLENAFEIKNIFPLSPEKLEEVALKNLVFWLLQGKPNTAIKIKENFIISPEKLNTPEIEQMALASLNNCLSAISLVINDAIKIKDNFPMSPEKVEEIALKNLNSRLVKGDIANAYIIKDKFTISQEKLDSPEVEGAALSGIISSLTGGKIDEALKLKNFFKISLEKLNSPEVEEAAIVCLDKLLSQSSIDTDKIANLGKNFSISPEKVEEIALKNLKSWLLKGGRVTAIKIKNVFTIPPEKLNSPEIEQAVLVCIDKALSSCYLNEARDIKNAFIVSPEKVEEIALKNIISYLTKGDFSQAIQVKEYFPLSPEKLNSPEIERLAMICLKNSFSNGRISDAIRVKGQFVISPEKLEEFVLGGLINRLLNVDYDSALRIKENFAISSEKLNSPEVEAAAAICLDKLLLGNVIEKGIEIKNNFPIFSEKVEEIVLKNLIIYLSNGNNQSAIKIINNFVISQEKLNSPEVKQAAGVCLDKLLLTYSSAEGVEIKNIFNISPEKVEEIALKNLIIHLLKGSKHASVIKKNFSISQENLNSPEVEEATLRGLVTNLSRGRVDEAINIKDNFSISPEKLNSSEVEAAALAGMRLYFLNNYLGEAVKIKDNFKISPEKLKDTVLKGASANLWSGKISGRYAREIVNTFSISLEKMLRRYFLNSTPEERRMIEFIGAILNEEERKEMLQKFGPEAEVLFQSGDAKAKKKPSSEKRNEIISNFKKKIIDSIEDESEARTFNKLAFVIKELDNQRGDDEQSTADFLFEISKDISKKLDDRKFLILVRKLSEINDPKANFFALRLAGQSRVRPLAFARAIQKLSTNSFIPKVPSQLMLEEKDGKKRLSREKVATLQKIISEYPNQFSTIVSTLSDPRLNDFDLVKEKESVFSSLNDFKAVTPIIFNRYRLADESGRKELVKKVNQIRPILFKNQPIKDIFKNEDREIFTEMVYIAYNPIGMNFNDVERLLEVIKDRTQDLEKYKFPEEGYDFSLDEKKGYRLKLGEKISPQILLKITDIFSGNFPKSEDEAKRISGTIAKLAKGGTDLKEAEIASLLALLAEEDQIKEFKARIGEAEALPRKFLSEAKENLGVFFNDNFSRALEQFLSANPQSKEKLEAILSRPERLESIKKKIGKQLEEKNLAVDWENPSQVIGASFSFFILKKLRQEISKEIKKYELAPEGEGEEMSSDNSDLKAYISKNVGSFFAKASAGICTAQNIPLFNRQDHFHINVVENNRTVQANIQAYLVDYPQGKKSLFLRGVNPNVKFIKDISVPAFCDKVIKVAKQFQQDNGLAGVYLSEQLGGWHALSNRAEVANYLAGKYLKKDKEREFSLNIVDGRRINRMYEV